MAGEQPARDSRRWLLVGAVLTALIVLAILVRGPVSQFLAHPQQVRTWIAGFGPWAPAAIVVLEMAQAIIAPLPGQAIEAAAGYLFGVWPGVLYAMTGIVAGSLISFSLARWLGRPLVTRVIRPATVERLDDLAARGGALFFFFIWLFPLLPDDLACLAAGLTPMPTRQFLLLMALGRLPGVLTATWMGANAERISLMGWLLILGAWALGGLVIWRWGERLQATILHLLQKLAVKLAG
jgi:uncharacterized membrane protein YdjX (TVP38/TMEM64 family)